VTSKALAGESEMQRSVLTVEDVADEPPGDWDTRTVDVPGGHVLQGRAWAHHRRSQGWDPRFVTFTDRRAALLLTHRQPPLPGFVAYASRGPVSAGDNAEAVARRAIALAAWCRSQGGFVLAVDPVLDASEAYESRLAGAGFRPAEEIQPSRNRLVLPLDADEETVLHRFTKSTRQRIRAAEQSGIEVAEDPAGAWISRFGELMDETAERKSFSFRTARGFGAWWRAVLEARQARFFVALHERDLVGALLVYVQGGQYATAFSADRAALRERFPGTMHLLRWTAIRAALAAGIREVDLGGVDLPGHRGLPAPGEPAYGMYQHKASFGATWVESAPAHEAVLRPWTYRASLVGRAVRRALHGRSGAG
jgi:lipid II:glycine glycyltransferase (peptidoglycan interpeptide bridge formation enzyme)